MVSVGRLAKEKNWEFLLDAAALCVREIARLRLVLIGDGPECQSLRDLALTLGIAERVDFIGEIPFEDVPAYLKAADFFAFASMVETQGLVTVEAMAAGLAVVAVNASGTCDIVTDGVQGFLVAEDPQAFAQAVRQLLMDWARLAEFRQAARVRARQFEMKTLAKSLLNVYEQSVADRKEGRFVQIQRETV